MHTGTAVGCKVEGCDRPYRSRGWCHGHYTRWRLGKPVDGPLVGEIPGWRPPKATLGHTRDRLLAGCRIGAWNECWPWLRTTNNHGYGMISVNGLRTYAHRLAFLLYKGPFPLGTEVDHLCNTRGCVNPGHLEAVTHSENLRRRDARLGRR